MNKWKKVKLGDICDILDSYRVPITAKNREVGIYPYYGANGIQDYVKDFIFDGDYVLVAEDGGYFGSKTKPISYKVSGKFWVNNHAHILKAKKDIFTDYLCYSTMFYDVSSLVNGATRQKLTQAALKEIKIPLPPIEEQKKIAARLDAVSDLLAKQKQLLSEQDTLIQSTFYDMFGTPEINEKGFPAHKISEICELNPKKPKEIDDNTECSFVPMSAVSEDGELNLTQIKLYEDVKKGFTYFAEEDVLFAKITPCMENGKGTIAKGLKNKFGFGSTEFHVLRPLNDISNARWLFQITKFKKFRENAEKSMTGSAGQKRVPAGFFDNYFIPVPPFELQQKFAAVAEQIESEKSKIKSAIAETQTLFNSMMSEYFEE